MKSIKNIVKINQLFTRFLRDKPEDNLRETAVLRFLCICYWSRSEQ